MSTGTMLFNPFTGEPRDPRDIESDPEGTLIYDGKAPLRPAQKPVGYVLRAVPANRVVWATGEPPIDGTVLFAGAAPVEAAETSTQGMPLAAARNALASAMYALSCPKSESPEGYPSEDMDEEARLAMNNAAIRGLQRVLALDALHAQPPAPADDARRLDYLEKLIDSGFTSACFEFDGGLHLTWEGANGNSANVRHSPSLREAIDAHEVITKPWGEGAFNQVQSVAIGDPTFYLVEAVVKGGPEQFVPLFVTSIKAQAEEALKLYEPRILGGCVHGPLTIDGVIEAFAAQRFGEIYELVRAATLASKPPLGALAQELVFIALGEVSMCWEPLPTGVFDSTRAKKIGDSLCTSLSRVALKP